MRLKKIAALVMAAALAVSTFTGCGWDEDEEGASSSSSSSTSGDNSSSSGDLQDDEEGTTPTDPGKEPDDPGEDETPVAPEKVQSDLLADITQVLGQLESQLQEDDDAEASFWQMIENNVKVQVGAGNEEEATEIIVALKEKGVVFEMPAITDATARIQQALKAAQEQPGFNIADTNAADAIEDNLALDPQKDLILVEVVPEANLEQWLRDNAVSGAGMIAAINAMNFVLESTNQQYNGSLGVTSVDDAGGNTFYVIAFIAELQES